jgi:hypothetical protein
MACRTLLRWLGVLASIFPAHNDAEGSGCIYTANGLDLDFCHPERM